MYPFGRMMKEMILQRQAPKLGLLDVHRSRHLCWPWDLDPWMELNNGRTLTLYDLGRIPMMMRTGLVEAMRRSGNGITVAGVSVRYRQRVRSFQKLEMFSRFLGWDQRFFYMEQTLWHRNQCANHILVRLAVTSMKQGGIVAPSAFLRTLLDDSETCSPELPGWVTKWIESESIRPWPPEMPK